MSRRLQLVVTSCRRCGKPVTTGNRSLFGMDALKAEYDRICSACMSEEEKQEMDAAFRREMPQAIVRGL